MAQRGSIVEHPFGTLKDCLGRDHFVCRGLELIGAELSMSALAYNMSRVIKILGVETLLREVEAWFQETKAVSGAKSLTTEQKAA